MANGIKQMNNQLRVNERLSLKEITPITADHYTEHGQVFVSSADNKLYFKRSGDNGSVTFQESNTYLEQIAAITPTEGMIIVGDAGSPTGWEGQTGSTARDSLGLGTSDNVTFNDISAGGDVVITGDLTVNGTTTTANTETVLIEDNLLVINNGETGPGVTAGQAGIEVDRGNGTSPGELSYLFVFDEASDSFMIGESGDLQPVATRETEGNMTDNGVAIWDSTNTRFETGADLTFDGSTLSLTGDVDASGTVDGATGFAVDGSTVIDSSNNLTNINTAALATSASVFLTNDSGTIKTRTAAEVAEDIGAITELNAGSALSYAGSPGDTLDWGGDLTNNVSIDGAYSVRFGGTTELSRFDIFTATGDDTASLIMEEDIILRSRRDADNDNAYVLINANSNTPVRLQSVESGSIIQEIALRKSGVGDGGIAVTDATDGIGFRYSSSTYTSALDTWVPHKKYVDDEITSAISGITIPDYAGGNGITRTGSSPSYTFDWGGALSADVAITGGGTYNVDLGTTGSRLNTLDMNVDTSATINGDDGTNQVIIQADPTAGSDKITISNTVGGNTSSIKFTEGTGIVIDDDVDSVGLIVNQNVQATQLRIEGTTVYLSKDGSDNMVFTDGVTGSKTLAQLAAGAAGYNTVTGDGGSSGSSTVTDPDASLDFEAGDGITVTVDEPGSPTDTRVVITNDEATVTTTAVGAGATAVVIGEVGTEDVIILDYFLTQGGEVEEGRIRVLVNATGSPISYSFTHEFNNTADTDVTFDSVTDDGSDVSLNLTNSGAAGSIKWKRAVIA